MNIKFKDAYKYAYGCEVRWCRGPKDGYEPVMKGGEGIFCGTNQLYKKKGTPVEVVTKVVKAVAKKPAEKEAAAKE